MFMRMTNSMIICAVLFNVISCSHNDRERLAKRVVRVNPTLLEDDSSLERKAAQEAEVKQQLEEYGFVVDQTGELVEKKQNQDKETVAQQEYKESLDLKHVPRYFSDQCQFFIHKNASEEYTQVADSLKRWIEKSTSADYVIPTIYYDSNSLPELNKNSIILGGFCDKHVSHFLMTEKEAEKDTSSAPDCGNPYFGNDMTMMLTETLNSRYKLLLFITSSADRAIDVSKNLPNIQDLAGSNVVNF
jgi:hypothetical protein